MKRLTAEWSYILCKLQKTSVVVVSKDTDVLVLMSYENVKFQPSYDWLKEN